MDAPRIEQRVGDQAFARLGVSLFPQKPAEDQAGEEANEMNRGFTVGIRCGVLREDRMFPRPEIPVGHFLVERFSDLLDIEGVIVAFLNLQCGDAEQFFPYQREIHHLQPLGGRAQTAVGSHGNPAEKSPFLRLLVILDVQEMPGGLCLVGENKQAVRMLAHQLVDDGPLKTSLKAVGEQTAIHHMKGVVFAAAREQDGIIDQPLAGGIRPAAHAERLVFALVVQLLPEKLFKPPRSRKFWRIFRTFCCLSIWAIHHPGFLIS